MALCKNPVRAFNGPLIRGLTPKPLFAQGEQGVWYDPSDLSTLFQDSAGTTPVTDVDQPVGRMLDKSGNGNHAVQATSASRPLLKREGSGRYYLLFDGTDDSLATSTMNMTATDEVTAAVALTKSSNAARGMLLEFTNASTGRFLIEAPPAGLTGYIGASGGSAVAFTSGSSEGAPDNAVLTLSGDISADTVSLRRNSTAVSSGSGNQGTGNFANSILYIGRRGGSSLPFNGKLYGLVVVGRTITQSELFNVEKWLNSKMDAF